MNEVMPTTGLAAFFTPVHERGNSIQGPLGVMLDTGGRPIVSIWVKSSGPALFRVSASVDGQRYRKVTEIDLPGAGEAHVGYFNAYRHIRVETVPPNINDNEIEIVATR